jgi:type I restriction enzyme M protein
METDGYSLDDKRVRIGKNDIPDIVEKWKSRNKNKGPKKGDKWLWVDIEEIKKNKYDLSISRYKLMEYEEIEYDKPEVIMEKVLKLEKEIEKEITDIKKVLIQ